MRNFTVANAPGGSIDTVPPRNVYPTMMGPTLGAQADAMSPYSHTGRRYYNGMAPAQTTSEPEIGTNNDTNNPAFGGGQTAGWWVALFVLLLGLMYGARRLGEASEYANLKLSAYNVIIISLAAIVGISFWKVVFSKVEVPGLSDIVMGV